MQPTFRLLLAHPSHFIALGFGSGLAPKGPGTAGTLAAWLLYPLLRGTFSDWQLLGFLVASFFFGIVACERTGRALGVADHGAIVWDEIVAFWLVLFFTPPASRGRAPPSACSASSILSSRLPSAGWTNAPVADWGSWWMTCWPPATLCWCWRCW